MKIGRKWDAVKSMQPTFSNRQNYDSFRSPVTDAFWKVLIREERAIAWVIPNTAEATRTRLDQYLVSIAHLEARTGETIPVDDWLKEDVPEVSWTMPVGCDRG